jgi:hypothetical protein
VTVWGTHGSEAADFADRLGARLGPTATFATTEHFNRQTARSIDQAAIFVPPAPTARRAVIFEREVANIVRTAYYMVRVSY